MENFLTILIFLIRKEIEEKQANRHFKNRQNEPIALDEDDEDMYKALPGTVPESVLNDPLLLLKNENDFFAKSLPSFTEEWFLETRAIYMQRQNNAEKSYYLHLDKTQNWFHDGAQNGDAFDLLRFSEEGTFLVSRNQEKTDGSHYATIFFVSNSASIKTKSIHCQKNMDLMIYSVADTRSWFKSITALMKHIIQKSIPLNQTILRQGIEKKKT
ncbi:unnamed protein product [Caenorhabditis nigoni]